jgi:hypothetical protein
MRNNGWHGSVGKRRGTGHRRVSFALALAALFVLGAIASSALADGDPFAPVSAITALVSGTDTTSTDTTTTDSASSTTDGTAASSADTTSAPSDTTTAATDTTSTASDASPAGSQYAIPSTETTTTSAIPSGPPVPYIVTFNSGVSDAQQQTDITDANGTPGDAISVLHMFSATFPAGEDAADAQTLAGNADVASVEQDLSRDSASTPNDPRYPDQWSLPQIGWDTAYGSISPTGTATVAILDTGVDASQPDLSDVVVPGTNIVTGAGNGESDPNGHGTAMAGIVGAATGNGEWIAGIGYSGVKIMPVTVLGSDGTGLDSDVINGVVYATTHGANVILMSFSNPGFSPALQSAINYGWSQGVVLVAATGNDGTNTVNYPAGDKGVIGVGSTGIGDTPSSFSNTGPDVFLAAPGENILTTDANGGYSSVSGTSASAAAVAAAAALIKASSVGASNGVVVNRLAESADAAGTASQTGNGRLNLDRAISDASSTSIEPAGAGASGGPFVGPYRVAAIKDGDGAMSVTPTSVTTSSTGNNFTFAFTAGGTGNMNGGSVSLDIPAGWTTPQTANSANPGFISSTAGTCTITSSTLNSRTLTVVVSSCSSGQTITISYNNVTAPSTAGSSAFIVKTKASAGGTLTAIGSSPAVTVNAPTNRPPTATVSLNTSSPTTNQTLTATATKSDPDGNPVTLTYVWKVNGATKRTTSGTSSLTDTFDLSVAGNGDRGDTVTVSVTPNDGTVDGTAAGASATVADSAPSVGTVAISPASPTTTQTLTATPSAFSDADGDTLVFHYVWKNGSTTVGSDSATLDLSQTGNGNKGDTITVSVTASDGTASSTAALDHVTVANSAPSVGTVVISPASPQTKDVLTATPAGFSDADGDTLTYHYQWFNGSTSVGGDSSTLDLGPSGNGDKGDKITVKVSASDGTASSSQATDNVTVVNTAPVMDTASIAEPAPKTNDTLHATATSHDADGDTVSYSYQWQKDSGSGWSDLTGETGSTLDLSQAGNGNKGDKLRVVITPNDGTVDGAPLTSGDVTVVNTAPVKGSVAITPSSATAPKTNDTLTATPSGFSDDDGDTLTYHYVWKNGSTVVGSDSNTLDLSVLGNGDKGDTIHVSVTASDGSDSSDAATGSVTVKNTAPTATVSLSDHSPKTNDVLTATATRADADPDAVSLRYVWKVNGTVKRDVTKSSGTAADLSDTFDLGVAGNGSKGDTVKVEVTPNDGTDDGLTVDDSATVVNSAPTANAGGPYTSAGEGSSIALSGSGTDADGDSLGYHWTYSAGAGVDAGTTCTFSPNALAQNPSITCNDDGSFTVSLVTNDGTASSTAANATVTFTNVAPVLGDFTTPSAGQLYAVGSGPTVSIPFTDAGTHDSHTCSINWDDGNGFVSATTTETAGSGSGSCGGTKTYAVAGVFTIQARVTDDDGGTATKSVMVVVYDPNGGFVTGGGWIMSPAGAYAADPTLTGKANFGFVSKYQKGAKIPSGNTEFQFQTGNLDFSSTVYEWLVISGSGASKAQYKGSGTINGAGDYGFMLTSIDGDNLTPKTVDKFRIKIWNKTTGATIYDNQVAGDPTDTADPTTSIGGGSIVIHDGK